MPSGVYVRKPFTEEQFESIFFKAWEDGHPNGYEEVLNIFEDIIKICKKIVDPYRENRR